MQGLTDNYESLSGGEIAFARYKVIRYLGRGSTSVVYAAVSTKEPERLVALKVLSSASSANPNLVELFRNEVKVVRSIRHQNVVEGYEYLKNGPWEAYAMELLEGGSLHDLLYHSGPLKLDECIHFLKEISQGVKALHDDGIVHRDLKPQNILMNKSWQAKITDFSTAQWINGKSLPYDFGQVGTFEYMSPEVLSKGIADVRSDIFAIGVIAYQMFTGQLPYESTQFADRIELVRRGKPKSPHLLRPECSKVLSRVIMKAMHERPSKRYPSIQAFLDALERARDGRSKGLLRRSRPKVTSW